MWVWVRRALIAAAAVFVVIQFVPYGRDHTNPPVIAEPSWDSPETRDLAVAACFDCHSNETSWPWYSNVAPMSWLVQRDVEEGRDSMNLSEWPSGEAHESSETVLEGSMPPLQYVWTHPAARLSESEKEALAAGLAASLGGEGGRGGEGREGGESDD